VYGMRKLLDRTGIKWHEIDLMELNEAFAAQVLACLHEMPIDPQKVNVNGGAIAMGHPLGASGARLVLTLVRQMQRQSARLGVTTLCIGVGQGLATLWERL
ncbi:MAG: 3-oxoadipyl-CoA thiolase, partial [Bacteroidia bacterium]